MMTPVEVTHYLCPETDGTDVTHHLQPQRDGLRAGEPSYEQACIWCKKTETELRKDITIKGAELHPQIAALEGPRHRRL